MNQFEIYYNDKWEFKNLELTLSRINNALIQAGFMPENLGKVIHIAGTNGKGSTSFFISQLLEQNGYSTALFTSPHIKDVNERISFKSENINNIDFDNIFQQYKSIIATHKLSYFECLFFIAAMWFSEKQPDFTILETGLGGRFDATNTILINDKLCVITRISQDHADILGHNIYGIIKEKLGILRKESPLILSINQDFIKDFIKKTIPNKTIEVTPSIYGETYYPFPYSENYATAKMVANYITNNSYSDTPSLKLPPCRLETLDNITFDGSHNPAGLLALLKSKQIKDSPCIIFSSTKDRDLLRTFNILSIISKNIILTTIPNNYRSIGEQEAKLIPCVFIKDPQEALNKALKDGNKSKILVTGSFYLCAYIKDIVNGSAK